MGFERVPVIYTDELTDTSLYSLAFSSVHGAYLPYLFTGYFTDGDNLKMWVFSNARRHEDMQKAVEQDLGKKLSCIWGQIELESSGLNKGNLLLYRLILHGELPNRTEAESLLREAVNPEDIHPDFKIILARK